MTFETLTPVLLFALVATITPGGATTLATASGANFGFNRSLPLIGGIAVGLGAMAAAAALGLGGLLIAVPWMQIAMKSAGSVYLFWLAFKIARSRKPQLSNEIARRWAFSPVCGCSGTIQKAGR